jgi:hypothetical protein
MTFLNNSCDRLRFVQTRNHKAQLGKSFCHDKRAGIGKNEGPSPSTLQHSQDRTSMPANETTLTQGNTNIKVLTSWLQRVCFGPLLISGDLQNPIATEEFKVETGNGLQLCLSGRKLCRAALASHSTGAARNRISTAHPARLPRRRRSFGTGPRGSTSCRLRGQPQKARGGNRKLTGEQEGRTSNSVNRAG